MLIRAMLLLICTGIIFLMTCVSSLHDLIHLHSITFTLQESPDLYKFFSPIPNLTKGFIIQKIGHIFGFLLLTVLTLQCFKSFRISFVFCILYGFMTEFLQLYFSRGGRLFDVGFDAVGIILGLLLYTVAIQINRVESRVQAWRNQSKEIN